MLISPALILASTVRNLLPIAFINICVDFTGVNLSYCKLTNVNLAGANMKGANLSYCDLRTCDLDGVNLQMANLTNCNFEDMLLNSVNFEGANFSNANCVYTSFVTCNILRLPLAWEEI